MTEYKSQIILRRVTPQTNEQMFNHLNVTIPPHEPVLFIVTNNKDGHQFEKIDKVIRTMNKDTEHNESKETFNLFNHI